MKVGKYIVLVVLAALLSSCSEELDFDYQHACRDDTMRIFIDLGLKYEKGIHQLDVESLRCTFIVDESIGMGEIVEALRRHGWVDATKIKGVKIDFNHEGWSHVLVGGDEFLVMRLQERRLEVMNFRHYAL